MLRSAPSVRTGFTLIELLVVMGILSLLMGMLMPMYGVVRRSSMKSQTQATLKKVEIALRLFKGEWGAYPYQAAYPASIDPGNPFPNRLHYRIGSEMATADRNRVIADMNSFGGLYAYACTVSNADGTARFSEGVQPSQFTYTFGGPNPAGDIVAAVTGWPKNHGSVWLLNHSAQEQVRMAVMSGNLDLRGPAVCSSATTVAYDLTGQALRAAAPTPPSVLSQGNPGMACDYLRGEIAADQVSGDDILDAYRRPLVYICQQVPAMAGQGGAVAGYAACGYDPRYFGLGAIGFDPATGPGRGLISGGRPLLLYGGRVRLSAGDAGDGQGPPPADAAYLPDPAALGHSDVRYYGAPGFEQEFELWSAGPDGAFAYMRDAAANLDNIAAIPYNRGLGLPGAFP